VVAAAAAGLDRRGRRARRARRGSAGRGVGAAAAVPVFARGDIWAVLLLLNRTEPPIGEPALRIARMWAQLIGQIGRGAAGHAADIENLLRLTGAQVIVYEERSLGILQATPALVRALGYGTAELDELRLDDIAPELEPASIAGLIAPLHDGRRDRVVVETIHRRADGSELPVELHVFHLLHGDRHLLLCIANDISERRRLEERLAQAQRLEAVGRLAGGLAHDIAGLLGSVGRAAEIVVIEQALDRAHEISRQLLGLARRQQASVPIAPAAVIAGMLDLLRRLNEAVTIELHVDPAARDAHVLVDQLQFERALINLVANAAHASPAGGRVDVAVAPAAEDGWLDVSVVDRGAA
jgi:PAS domain S-box-containing protein